MLCLLVCLCNMCTSSAHRGQKRALDPIELESRMLVNCYGFLESNSDCLQEQQVLLTLETSLQPLKIATLVTEMHRIPCDNSLHLYHMWWSNYDN